MKCIGASKKKCKKDSAVSNSKSGLSILKKELELLAHIRRHFTPEQIELRVDANGAFTPTDALDKLQRLSEFHLHSIEQPIRAGQWKEMSALCASAPFPIALDEELIGINQRNRKIELLETIRPQYIILKPSLHGGISGSEEWMELAAERGIVRGLPRPWNQISD